MVGESATADNLQTIASAAEREGGSTSLVDLGTSPAPATLMMWFEGLLAVQRAAAGSNEFYSSTAKAVVELIGLEQGLVLLRRDDGWEVAASYPDDSPRTRQFSRTVLTQLEKAQRTFFEAFDGPPPSQSLAEVRAVVASPVFDEKGELVGAVYGARGARRHSSGFGIQPLEAQVVQLLAGAVSAGLARVEREAELVRTRVQFEQFFSPELVRELERDPSLLEGQERDVTILFSDLRSYSRLSEKLGARDTYHLLTDVMDALTNRIVAHSGVVVDYHGDGMAAMWNAPSADQQHAVRACEAALSMLEEMPALNEAWAERVGGPLQIGVGVNTGSAQVGNAGSRKVLKYGPLGHTVNLASRVEGATKHLGVPFLITGTTREGLSDDFVTRRICQVRVVGIEGAVDLYECQQGPADEAWTALREAYESALALYEGASFDEAAAAVAALRQTPAGEADRPAAILAEQIKSASRERSPTFDPSFRLQSK
jgi:adenylate cyclase